MVSTPEVDLGVDDTILIRDLYPKLRRFAAIVGPLDVDPGDLVQEALVRTIRQRPLSSYEHPSSYLWRVIANLAKDHRRRLGRQRRALGRIGPTEQFQPHYPSDLGELERLTPKARAVLYLHEVDGYSYGEIARMLGANEASLRQTATRARRTLRMALIEEVHDGAT